MVSQDVSSLCVSSCTSRTFIIPQPSSQAGSFSLGVLSLSVLSCQYFSTVMCFSKFQLLTKPPLQLLSSTKRTKTLTEEIAFLSFRICKPGVSPNLFEYYENRNMSMYISLYEGQSQIIFNFDIFFSEHVMMPTRRTRACGKNW